MLHGGLLALLSNVVAEADVHLGSGFRFLLSQLGSLFLPAPGPFP